MSKIVFIFPGQGSQYVGMGRSVYNDFPEAKEILDSLVKKLDFELLEIIFNDEFDLLNKTQYTQPALVAIQIMLFKVLLANGIIPDATLGLSLGEYSALVLAESISELDAINIVAKRGKIMAEALPIGISSMSAVLAINHEELEKICADVSYELGEIVEIANYNSPGQLVIGGHINAVQMASKKAIKKGAKKAIKLNVSGAFHTSLLKNASLELENVLVNYNIVNPIIPVVHNATADYTDQPIKDLLTKQISSAVKFQQSIQRLIDDGFDIFIEVGPGKTLSGLVKKINRSVLTFNVESTDDILKLIRTIGGKNDE